MSDILDGVKPVNISLPATQNQSEILTRYSRTIPAMTPDAIAASVAGRKAGLVHDVQQLFDDLHKCEQEMNDLGPRPVATDSIPAITDPTSPFGNNRSLGNVLRDAGLSQMEVDAVAARLRPTISILPDLRHGLLAASGSTREAAFKGSLAVIDAIRAELKSWEKAVLASAKQEPFAREWDSKKQALESAKGRARAALALVSAERIENYKTAVDAAATREEMGVLRGMLKKIGKI